MQMIVAIKNIGIVAHGQTRLKSIGVILLKQENLKIDNMRVTNNMIHLFGWGGDIDRAVEWLERSYQMRDHEVAYMGALGISDELRADPRFQEILRKLNLEGPPPET